jgi:tetratricopeptide (TPR) repeat protein
MQYGTFSTLCPAIGIGSTDVYALVYESLGLSLTKLCRFDEAKAAFDTALELDPKNFSTLVNRSYLHFLCSRFAEMLADAVAATNINPENCPGWINRCAALIGLGLYTTAVRYGRKAVEVDPKNSLAHRYFAKALCGQGDSYGALSHFEEAIAHSSDAALTHELLNEHAACARDVRVKRGAARPLRSFRLWSCTVLMCALLILCIAPVRTLLLS